MNSTRKIRNLQHCYPQVVSNILCFSYYQWINIYLNLSVFILLKTLKEVSPKHLWLRPKFDFVNYSFIFFIVHVLQKYIPYDLLELVDIIAFIFFVEIFEYMGLMSNNVWNSIDTFWIIKIVFEDFAYCQLNIQNHKLWEQ